MNFDQIIERRGTHSAKWDNMEAFSGISPDEGIPMWVADMEFRAPEVVQRALQKMVDHGIYGYYGGNDSYLDAVQWWAENRHGWVPPREGIYVTNGIVNGLQLCLQAWTKPGDGVVIFTPVYHVFPRLIRAQERVAVECALVQRGDRYEMDFDTYESQMTGNEKMLVLCSPHNPGGRVWSPEELQQVADFAKRHDLILVSDEIHCDLTLPGHTHTAMTRVDPSIMDRLVMMTSATKTFNLAGGHVGNVIICDEKLRRDFAKALASFGGSQNSFGQVMSEAAYSPEGAEWLDALLVYLAENARIFEEGVNAIPGLQVQHLEGTYLAWVDFSGTGMTPEEVRTRIKDAGIAVNDGISFGKGGEDYQRFNLATQKVRVEEVVRRMRAAFSDLQ